MLSASPSSSISCDVIRIKLQHSECHPSPSWLAWEASRPIWRQRPIRRHVLFKNATRSLRSLMTLPPISSASLPPPSATTLADSLSIRQQGRHADFGNRGDHADGRLNFQLEVVLEQRHNSRAISNRRASTHT